MVTNLDDRYYKLMLRWQDKANDAEATATRRKELLRRVYADATNQGHCPFCRMECTAYSFGSWGEREYKHAADCELARELGDDTVG